MHPQADEMHSWIQNSSPHFQSIHQGAYFLSILSRTGNRRLRLPTLLSGKIIDYPKRSKNFNF